MRVSLAALTGYLAPEGFLAELQHELGSAVCESYGNLVLATGPMNPVVWTANVWRDPCGCAKRTCVRISALRHGRLPNFSSPGELARRRWPSMLQPVGCAPRAIGGRRDEELGRVWIRLRCGARFLRIPCGGI
jgi:hypothetical protein